jgi:hypothetical protein
MDLNLNHGKCHARRQTYHSRSIHCYALAACINYFLTLDYPDMARNIAWPRGLRCVAAAAQTKRPLAAHTKRSSTHILLDGEGQHSPSGAVLRAQPREVCKQSNDREAFQFLADSSFYQAASSLPVSLPTFAVP